MPVQHDFELHPESAAAYLRALAARSAPIGGISVSNNEEFADCFVIHMFEPKSWRKWRDTGFSRSWASTCVANFVMDFRARLETLASHEISAETCKARYEALADMRVDLVNEIQREEIGRELEAAIMHLTRGQQKAVRLRFYKQLSHVEMAQALDISAEAARMLISRALPQLLKLLLAVGFDVNDALALWSPPPH